MWQKKEFPRIFMRCPCLPLCSSRLMLGFMSVTAFLSMWISNTATTAMMLPIAQAVLEQLSKTEAERDERELREGRNNPAFEMAEVTDTKIPFDTVYQSKPISLMLVLYKNNELRYIMILNCGETSSARVSISKGGHDITFKCT